MSVTTGTVNAPPSGTNPILVATGVTIGGNTGDVQAFMFVDPDSGSLRIASITPNGIKVDTTPLSKTLSTLSTATSAAPLYVKTSAGVACKLISTDASNAQTQTITIIDQSTGAANTANIVASQLLGPGAVVTLDIPCSTGIGIYSTGALTSQVCFTWS